MKKLLVAVAMAAGMFLAMSPPALASPVQLQVEKAYAHDQALTLDISAPAAHVLDAKMVAPLADKSAGKKKSNDKDEASQGNGRAARAEVPFHLRL